jgi:hypothetical protein
MEQINNLELIKSLLKFESNDDFYHLQIIKRKKEHPELGSNSYIIKTYYIQSLQYLEDKMSEIICLCDFHNARAMINLNKRSFEKLAYQMLKKVTDCILNKDFKSVRKSYESVCGSFSNETNNKKWIVDIDTKDNTVIQIETDIIKLEPFGQKVLACIPTKNGYHLITNPFRLDLFKQQYPEIDIHKNNPTLLYYGTV